MFFLFFFIVLWLLVDWFDKRINTKTKHQKSEKKSTNKSTTAHVLACIRHKTGVWLRFKAQATQYMWHSAVLRLASGNVSRDHDTRGAVGHLSRRVGVDCFSVWLLFRLYVSYYITSVSQSCFFSIYTINATSTSQNILGARGRPWQYKSYIYTRKT